MAAVDPPVAIPRRNAAGAGNAPDAPEPFRPGPDPAEWARLRRRIQQDMDAARTFAAALREWSRDLAVHALQLRELAREMDRGAGEVAPEPADVAEAAGFHLDDDDGEP